jgi:KipI family sensor histidine kinase inhibitor
VSRIRPFGEAALLVEPLSGLEAQSLAAALRTDPPADVTGAVAGRSSVLVDIEPLRADIASVTAAIDERLHRLPPAPPGRARTIPVVYGGAMGPDLADVAERCGMAAGEVIERHAGSELTVEFIGFAPGFAYLGGLPEELRVPRLATPRTRTPAGSVGLADGMSGIYPGELPGGWRVIGRTPTTLFDPHREPPAYLLPGDRVWFEPIDAIEWDRRAGAPADW